MDDPLASLVRMRLAALAIWLIAPSIAIGQSLRAIVVDSMTRTLIGDVTVAVFDSAGRRIADLRSSDSGAFIFRPPAPGWYEVELRKVGYVGLKTGALSLHSNADVARTFRMTRSVVALDTIRSEASRGVLGVTPGRDVFRKHMLEGKGIFLSGLEIQRSRLSVSQYLGTLPGFRLVENVQRFSPVSPAAFAPPVIPAEHNRFLISTIGNQCLYGRIDHWTVFDLMFEKATLSIDDLLKVENIQGVELYHDVRELPNEWRGDGSGLQLVWIAPPEDILMGTTSGKDLVDLIKAVPLDTTVVKPAKLPRGSQRAVLTRIQGAETKGKWVAVFVPKLIDWRETQRAFQINSVPPPACGLVQIWTNISW